MQLEKPSRRSTIMTSTTTNSLHAALAVNRGAKDHTNSKCSIFRFILGPSIFSLNGSSPLQLEKPSRCSTIMSSTTTSLHAAPAVNGCDITY